MKSLSKVQGEAYESLQEAKISLAKYPRKHTKYDSMCES